MDKKEIIALTILFLISFIFWTLPLRGQTYPFGEGDAAHQFGIADWMATSDIVQREYPLHIAAWYGHINKENYFAPAYAPPYMINLATFQVIGNERFLPKGLFIAFISIFPIIAGIYFVSRKLFGFFPAVLSSFLIIFELRLIMSYIWGQRPILTAIGMTPLVFYCFYRYIESKKEKPIYLIFMAIFMAISATFHPITLMFEVMVLALYSLVMAIINKQLPFSIKHLILSIGIFILLFSPFLIDYTNQNSVGYAGFKITNISSLFKWYDPGENPDNAPLFSYLYVNGGFWTLPLLLFGLIIIVTKRNDKNWLIICWLIGLYLVLHLEVIGFGKGKIDRIFKATSPIFYMVIGIGLVGLANLIKSKNFRILMKYGLVSLFIILTVSYNAKPAYSTLKNAYSPIMRITDQQYNTVQWIDKNLPDDSVIFPIGILTYPKARWMHMLSHKAFFITLDPNPIESWQKANDLIKKQPIKLDFSHILIDYSDYALVGDQGGINNLNKFEEFISKNASLVYNQNYMKVYRLGP